MFAETREYIEYDIKEKMYNDAELLIKKIKAFKKS